MNSLFSEFLQSRLNPLHGTPHRVLPQRQEREKVPGWYKIVSVMIAVLVFVSTLVTKQHVIVDVIGGVAVAELTWFVSCRTNGWKIYRNLVRKAGGENGK